MKHLIFSDVHGNLEALQAVLEFGATAGVGFHICLGDIVGYGANPNECVDTLRNLPECVCIKGNHDAAVVDSSERSFFHDVALQGVRYTEAKLTPENREFIENLPYTHIQDDLFIAVHASPFEPEEWEYILDQGGAKRAFGVMKRRVAFIGHTHSPALFTDEGRADRLVHGRHVKIEAGVRYIINVGSVGQPRDGNPNASFVIFDDETLDVEAVRVEYEKTKAAEKILKAGLPAVLAERLLVGY